MGFGLRPAGNTGFWGPVTSTLDWCEENYVVSRYLAEFWNSTSNAAFIITTMILLYSVNYIGVTEMRTYLSIYGITLVGVGSFLFHGSLWFQTQMMDELPMIYASCFLVFANLRVFPETNKNNTRLAIGLVTYAVTVTIMYLYLKNPVFHEVAYAVLISSLFLLPPVQISHIKANYPSYASRIRGLWVLYTYAVVSYLSGFGLWGVDNNFCENLRGIRAAVGYPWRVFFELHVWWHVGTAIGTYTSILLVTYFRQLAVGRSDVYVKWVAGAFPVLTSELSYVEIRRMLKNKSL